MFKFFFLLGTVTLCLPGVKPPGLNLAASDLFYLLAFLVFAFDGLASGKPMRSWILSSPYWLSACLILIGGLVASIQAAKPSASVLSTLEAGFLYSVWISMGIAMVKSQRQVRNLVIALLIGLVIPAAISIWDYMTGMRVGPSLYLLSIGSSGIDPSIYILYLGRYSGTLGHPNILAHATVVGIPIALDLFLSSWSRKQVYQIAIFGFVSVLLIGVNLLTGSIAGLVGAVIGGVLILLVRILRGPRPNLLLPVSILVAAIGLTVLLSTEIVSGFKLWGFTGENLDRALRITGPARLSLNAEAWSLIMDNPFIGYGMDQGSSNSVDPTALVTIDAVHNTLVRGWLAGGILAFVGLAIIYWKTLSLALRSLLTNRQGVPFLYGLSASILAWAVMDMAQPSFQQRFTWLTAAILYGLIRNEEKRRC